MRKVTAKQLLEGLRAENVDLKAQVETHKSRLADAIQQSAKTRETLVALQAQFEFNLDEYSRVFKKVVRQA